MEGTVLELGTASLKEGNFKLKPEGIRQVRGWR